MLNMFDIFDQIVEDDKKEKEVDEAIVEETEDKEVEDVKEETLSPDNEVNTQEDEEIELNIIDDSDNDDEDNSEEIQNLEETDEDLEEVEEDNVLIEDIEEDQEDTNVDDDKDDDDSKSEEVVEEEVVELEDLDGEDVEEAKDEDHVDNETEELHDQEPEEDLHEIENEDNESLDTFSDVGEYISEEYLDGESVTEESLDSLVMDQLREILDKMNVEYVMANRKPELINMILSNLGIETKEIDYDKTNQVVEKIKSNSVKSNKRTKVEVEDNIIIDMPLTDMTYEQALEVLQPSFVDEEWNMYKNEIDERLGNIHIDDDMNPGTLKLTISELSELRQEIWFNYQKIKTLYETLGSKEPEGLIERVKKIAYNPNDRNDMERRRTGIKACLEYVAPNTDTPINLFEMLDETRERYNFLKSVMESIRYKTNALITMNGALKLEHNHLD